MGMTIGKLAKKADVTIETIRYYQRIGLLQEPAKPEQGYRSYPEENLIKIRFIKRAQHAGFSLKEVAEIIALSDNKCADVRHIAEQKIAHINQQIDALLNLRNNLKELIKGCQTDNSTGHCTLIETLASDKFDLKSSQ
ncbi:MerR family transcriptional regulator [Methyloprofundus sedimenti]|uniref:Mercuric resistance operon regulatory protein n=1 Tax=Methyloprofundus sedimenti TaxID=1420851 RepID=A0A1V8M3A3_9GAMM|nr:MerR family transcriptional regulator [Methyloprofundus sedimenti]OQK16045.1 MerR family transcriptional regulator [Methyloprofundus sedimenti]